MKKKVKEQKEEKVTKDDYNEKELHEEFPNLKDNLDDWKKENL